MVKNYEVTGEQSGISAEDMELINKQSLKKLTPDEIFTFSVILCDNEIDRDFEKFSDESLRELETLFVGKTGILNHSNRSEDQSCRTYKTELITDKDKKTSLGEPYKYLKAWCYTVRSSKNADFIKDIESGIKKEVSVSCNFSEKVCSICGEGICSHRAGQYYGDGFCYKTIRGVTDAYEWSFVAVPAQRGAGVTKSASKNAVKEQIEKAKEEKELSFAALFRNEMKERAKKGFSLVLPELESSVAEEIINLLTAENLSALTNAFDRKTKKMFPVISQFAGTDKKQNDTNSQFKF